MSETSARAGESPLGRALVVDDDKAIRALTTTVLQRWGLTVDMAANGREALALTADHSYAVIVLDLMMPEMNGLEVIEHLRARDAALLQRVVVVTAAVQLTRGHLPEDICHVLLKPFDLGEFQTAVSKCMSGDPPSS